MELVKTGGKGCVPQTYLSLPARHYAGTLPLPLLPSDLLLRECALPVYVYAKINTSHIDVTMKRCNLDRQAHMSRTSMQRQQGIEMMPVRNLCRLMMTSSCTGQLTFLVVGLKALWGRASSSSSWSASASAKAASWTCFSMSVAMPRKLPCT